jgi:putative FmdB family regulatory protein
MPLYEYQCTDCNNLIELFQTYDEMNEVKDSLRCQKCEGRMQFVFPVPTLHTDTTFAAGWGDGFQNENSLHRKRAMAAARAAGVSTSGKTYCPSLCEKGKPKDPKAWVPHHDAKEYIRKRCRELNKGCEDLGVKQREPETDPHEGPYTVAPDIVEREVERVVENDYEGNIAPEKLPDLVEATQERLSGNQD